MSNFKEQPTFGIKSVIEQTSFESSAVRSFFSQWCKINDSIAPRFVTREKWESLGEEVLKRNKNGTRTLFIPKDLQLWEMVGVMECVDHDTFSSRPEIAIKHREQILALGKTFQHAGIYIAQRLESISKGRGIAEALAEELYSYGKTLASGTKSPESVDVSTIGTLLLGKEETEEVDQWLAGESLYASRYARVEKLEEVYPKEAEEFSEQVRRETLAQFFRVAEKAFALKQKSEEGVLSQGRRLHSNSWQSDTPLHAAFLAKIEGGIKKEVETPRRELVAAMFRGGLELLKKNMGIRMMPEDIRDELFHAWEGREIELYEALRIDELRENLEWVRVCGSTESIGAYEHEIIDTINQAVSLFPHGDEANNPSEMVLQQCVNCLGGSMLGGAFLSEVGIPFLAVDAPGHSLLFVLRDDGVIEWRDMINSTKGIPLDDDMFEGVTIADIIAFSEHPREKGMVLRPKTRTWKSRLYWIKKQEQRNLVIFGPEYGQKIQVLNNMGNALFDEGYYDRAREAYEESIAHDPVFSYPYYGLGNALAALGRDEEAIEAYRKAISIDSGDSDFYHELGNTFLKIDRNEEAIEVYRKAIALAPQESDSYGGLGDALANLHRNEEAIKAYRKYITLVDRDYDADSMENIRGKIRDLQ
ncbi:MAG: tetratricopeptide repeat protein [Parcubacteria group bacterium]|nr:tetratricopeptide repeat protein [Parcubacteria group bacterium]